MLQNKNILPNTAAPCTGNVKVAVRIRPLCAREHLSASTILITPSPIHPEKTIMAAPSTQYCFDAVFGEAVGQEQVYDELVGGGGSESVVGSFLEGFNCSVIAYGQTGSGKTFTMGTGQDDVGVGGGGEDEGIVPRAARDIFERLSASHQQQQSDESGPETNASMEVEQESDHEIGNNARNSANPGGSSFEVYCSFIELYNEQIRDLLQPTTNSSSYGSNPCTATIRQDPRGNISVTGIEEIRVHRVSEVMRLLQMGTLSRTTKSTEMNGVSSRSHAIFTLTLRQTCKSNDSDGGGGMGTRSLLSKLHFVDLAGSERMKRTQATGQRARESISINSGLLALGNVISALAGSGQKDSFARYTAPTHIPYRNSKLTRLLQDSLGGNSRTLMIACVSPSSNDFGESINTLKYAQRARNIRNVARVGEDGGTKEAFEIMQLRKIVSSLKQELLQIKTMGGDGFGEGRRRGRVDVHAESESDRIAAKDRIRTLEVENKRLTRELQAYKQKRAKSSTNIASTAMAVVGERSEGQALGDQIESPRSPATWMSKTRTLVQETRGQLEQSRTVIRKLSSTNTAIDGDDKGTAVAYDQQGDCQQNTNEAILLQLQNDQVLKQKLLQQLQECNHHYTAMQDKYSERINLLAANAKRVECERDQLLARSLERRRKSANACDVEEGEDGGLSKHVRSKYEERIRQLCRQVNDLRTHNTTRHRPLTTQTQTQTQAQISDTQKLKETIATLRTQKASLTRKLHDQRQESARHLKTQVSTHQQSEAIQKYRQEARQAQEQARKLKKALEFQRALVQKRLQQCVRSRECISKLVGVVRDHRIPITPGMRGIICDGGGPDCDQTHPPARSQNYPEHNPFTVDDGDTTSSAATRLLTDSCQRLSISKQSTARETGSVSNRSNPFSTPTTNKTQTPTTREEKESMPQSILRMSPMLARRDFFARIADKRLSHSLSSSALMQCDADDDDLTKNLSDHGTCGLEPELGDGEKDQKQSVLFSPMKQ